MIKTEKGVMVMKNGKAWGKTYADGHSTSYGWLNPADHRAEISDPQFCKQPTDVTYENSHYVDELKTAKIVHVERHTNTIVTILDK